MNTVEDEQALEIEVFADDELVYETTMALEAATVDQLSGERLEKNWPDEARTYRLRVQSEVEDDPVEERLDEAFAGSCETVLGLVRPDRLEMARGTGGKCYE